MGLPIARVRDEILGALRQHDVVVVSGETGSGKTTQVGLACTSLGENLSIGGLRLGLWIQPLKTLVIFLSPYFFSYRLTFSEIST